MGHVKALLEQGIEVEVESPDGFVPVTHFVEKGMWDEHILEVADGTIVRVSGGHLFETDRGWEEAKDLVGRQAQYITKSGLQGGVVKLTGQQIPIVDITVDHPNHRYWTNGISSHNTGAGKSLFMCHVAASTLMQSKNVLYITMEMAEERIAERIDANLLNLSMDELKVVDKNVFDTRIQKLAKKTQGKLIIKEYPTSTAHAGHFRALIEDLKSKKDFVPHLVVIDYLNICASSRMRMGSTVNSYTFIKSIAEELRGLAVEYNIPILTATQTNRQGYDNSDVDMSNVSESSGISSTVDLMLAIIRSEELDQLDQIMIKQLKNRYADPSHYKRFVVGVDRSKMKLFNCEQSAQDGLSDSGQPDDVPLYDRSKQRDTNFGGFKFRNLMFKSKRI